MISTAEAPFSTASLLRERVPDFWHQSKIADTCHPCSSEVPTAPTNTSTEEETLRSVTITSSVVNLRIAAMSWMDSWSRPTKRSAVPPPLYLTAGEDVPYCHTCGRVISSKKPKKGDNNNITKYCSDRCRHNKPGPVDRKVERIITALLNDEPDSGLESTGAKDRFVKGDHRIIVTCDEIEEVVFGSRFNPEKVYGRRKNRASRAIKSKNEEWTSVDMEDTDEDEEADQQALAATPVSRGAQVRPSQIESDVNFSVGGERGRAEKLEETSQDLEKRQQGQRQADERELVRRAARRAVVFGFESEGVPLANASTKPKHSKRKTDEAEATAQPIRRKCEAVMQGAVVEPSYAKGNWSIRWREA